MEDHIAMSELAEGERGRVVQIGLEGRMGLRMRTLGLIENSAAECLHRSASGSISAYLICGAVIAVRKEDASKVMIAVE